MQLKTSKRYAEYQANDFRLIQSCEKEIALIFQEIIFDN